MNFKPTIIFLSVLYFLCNIYACSSEPANTGECIDKYMSGVKIDRATKEIERACQELFDTDKTDDEYYKCLLKSIPEAKTDKDVNIILRRCTVNK